MQTETELIHLEMDFHSTLQNVAKIGIFKAFSKPFEGSTVEARRMIDENALRICCRESLIIFSGSLMEN
jgi:hypothetical protein